MARWLGWLRFHFPLVEPDVQISRIRLSIGGSAASPTRSRGAFRQAEQTECGQGLLEGPQGGLRACVFAPMPPVEPVPDMAVDRPIGGSTSAYAEVVLPTT